MDKDIDYELLNIPSAFIPHVYESIWIKVKVKNGADKIIGNVYRPNSAPRANLEKAINIHNTILENFQKDRKSSKCEILFPLILTLIYLTLRLTIPWIITSTI